MRELGARSIWSLSLLLSEYVPCKGWEEAFAVSDCKGEE